MAEFKLYMSGFLRKRQRGKHLQRESQRKNLKFQERYCTLTEHSFTYSKKKNSKARGSFPAERIKVIINTDPKAFKKGTLNSPDLCFQIGDEEEILYLIAPSMSERKVWKDAFLQVATDEGNEMLDHYHWGAYGSKATGQWSCCSDSRRDAAGCRSAATLTRKDSDVSQTSSRSDDTLKSDADSQASSIRYSSSCSSGLSSYSSMEPDHLSPKIHFEPVKFNDQIASAGRSRTGTNESGIDMNKPAKSRVRRQQRPSVDSSEIDSDIMSSPDILSDEGTEDEGIGRNVRKHVLTDIQAKGNKETMCAHQGVSTECSMFTLAYSSTLPQPLSTLLLHQNSLIIGMNGMLQVWGAATNDLTLETSLKIAGQVISLDSWNDFIAVGSSVVQLIQLTPGADPKRILYAKGRDRLQSPQSQFLVAFLGGDGHLATAKVGGSLIDIWAPPPTHSQVVTKPESCIALDSGTILSLTASKHSTNTSVTVLTKGAGCMKLNTLDWKVSNLPVLFKNPFELIEGQAISNYSPCIVNVDGMYTVLGNKKEVSLIDVKTGEIAHSITLDDDILCMNYTKGVITVGTTDGKVMILSSDNLTNLGQLEDEQNIASPVAIATETDLGCVYVAHEGGILKAWNAHPSTQYENGPLGKASESLMGVQLCSEGILTRRQLIPINNHDDLSLSFQDVDVHLQLPAEILAFPSPSLEVAFAPLGPGIGSQFVLPDGMIPVSPAVWLCFSPQKKFNNPAVLKLPYCFKCENHKDTEYLQFLKAEYNDISQDKGSRIVTFRPIDRTSSKFPLGTPHGIVEDHHFCIYCLVAYGLEDEVIGKMNYCLTILKPTTYPKDKANAKIYCIFHLDLEGCRQLVKEQTPDGYVSEEKLLEFDTGRYDSALEIIIDRDSAENCQWMITLQSDNKIYAEDVNFFNYRNAECLDDACKAASLHCHYPYVYPPRFTLEVSSKHAVCPSRLKLSFTGAKREMSTEIQLDWPMSELDLQLHDRDCDRGNNGYWPSQSVPVHFTSQTDTNYSS